MADESDFKERIEDIHKRLEYGDIPTKSLFDASKSLGALIVVCQHLTAIAEEQQRRIKHLEDILQNRLEAAR